MRVVSFDSKKTIGPTQLAGACVANVSIGVLIDGGVVAF